MSLSYLFFIGMSFGAIWLYMSEPSPVKISPSGKSSPILVFRDVIPARVANVRKSVTVAMPDEKNLTPVSDGMPKKVAWRENAVKTAGLATTGFSSSAKISIVIDDLGVAENRTLDVIRFDAPLTLSFLPYARNLPALTQYARSRGHELMVHMPMEPKGGSDPGPHALLSRETPKEIAADLTFNLSRFTGYVGFNNHMGSAFTESRAGLDLVLKETRRRGMLVLDSRTSGHSLLAEMATEYNIPNMTRDIFLDNEQDVDYILVQLRKLEGLALKRGEAIAIGHPYPETIIALKRWLPTLKKKGISIVPLSYLMMQKYQEAELANHQDGVIETP